MKSRVEAVAMCGGQISMLQKQEDRYFWCSFIKNIDIKHNSYIKKETLQIFKGL